MYCDLESLPSIDHTPRSEKRALNQHNKDLSYKGQSTVFIKAFTALVSMGKNGQCPYGNDSVSDILDWYSFAKLVSRKGTGNHIVDFLSDFLLCTCSLLGVFMRVPL